MSKVGVIALAQPVQMYSQAQRAAITGTTPPDAWFDGVLEPWKQSGSDFYTFAADGKLGTVKAVGPITNLAATSSVVSMGALAGFDYRGGGPVMKFTGSDNDLAMIVHLEKFPAGGATKFYSSYGVAKTTNGGTSWSQLGQFLTPAHTYDAAETTNQQDVGSGTIVVSLDGLYYKLLFREYVDSTLTNSYQSVARCSIASFNTAIAAGTVPTFDKWQGGSTWGGTNTGTNLTTMNNRFFHPSAWKDSGLGVYLMVANYAPDYPSVGPIYPAIQFSNDGEEWYGLTILGVTSENSVYCSIVPTTITGTKEGTGPWTLVYGSGTPWTAYTIQTRQITLGNLGRFARAHRL